MGWGIANGNFLAMRVIIIYLYLRLKGNTNLCVNSDKSLSYIVESKAF